MPEESSASPLAIDLDLSFGPAWARETDSKDRLERLARQHGGGEEERPRRGGDRGERGDHDRRPPRREGGSGGGKPRRDDRRAPRSDRQERQEPKREAELNGWEIKFTPDRHGVEGLAKQIKSSGRSYPLFDLARLVLDKSERYVVDFRKATEDATPLWQVKADGTLWPSESEAIAQALSANLDRFYRREQQTVEPPKGTVQIVGVCGMSGTLLGPPTHHDYQVKITQLYKERFSHLPFETYKSRIRMERDEALIEKWKEQQSTRDIFYPRQAETEPTPTPEPPSAPQAEDSTVPSAQEITPEVTAEVESELSTEAAEPAPVESAVESTPETTSETSEEALKNMTEVERHFREHHAMQEIVAIRQKVSVPGPAAVNDSAASIVAFTRRILDELERFPLPTAQTLAHQLNPQGLHVFKTLDRITHIGPARPRFLDLETTAVSDPLRAMIEYLNAHSTTPRAEQWKGLVGLRPETDAEAAMARDLRWLLQEGYVIDFIKTGLCVFPRPTPPKKETTPESIT